MSIDNAIQVRLGHPLISDTITNCKSLTMPCYHVELKYTESPIKSSYIEDNLLGRSGWLHVEKLSIDSFEGEDHLLISCFTDSYDQIPDDVATKMLSLFSTVGSDLEKIPSNVLRKYNEDISCQRFSIIEESSLRNQNFFDDEMDKLDTWAADMKLSLDREIRDLDVEIRLRKGEAKKMTKLQDKIAAQRLVRELESKRKEKRQSLYEAQDAVDQKKEDLINRVEAMLNQKTEQNQLFTFKWTLV